MKLLRFKACLLAMNRGNGESKITDYNGRCRNGWVFGQGFDSPQVHKKKASAHVRWGLFLMDLREILTCKVPKIRGFRQGRCSPVESV